VRVIETKKISRRMDSKKNSFMKEQPIIKFRAYNYANYTSFYKPNKFYEKII
jgi:hypothetical protein